LRAAKNTRPIKSTDDRAADILGPDDETLGWCEDANGLVVSDAGRTALDADLQTLAALTGSIKPKSAAIRGQTFRRAAVVENADALAEAIGDVVVSLLEV
jgi:hypothetical protein